jgi:hypothetical protein
LSPPGIETKAGAFPPFAGTAKLALAMEPRAVFLVLAASLTLACDAAKTVDDAAKATKSTVDEASKKIDDAKALADKTTNDAKTLADKTTAEVKRIADATTLAAKKAWAGLTDTGELSKNSEAWLKERAASVDGAAVEKVIDKGVQVAPVALEIALVLNAAVDDDTAIEPIYQKIEGEQSEAEVDAAIAAMPRVEVIDGVKVGYSQLSTLDTSKKIDEQAYLLTWRRDDRLIGLVYRTKRTIDLEMLVKETPRLMEMTKKALADQ